MVIVITGCSSGIGLETALAFARRGDTTVATMRNTAKADTLRSRAAEENLTIDVEQLDVCDEESVAACIASVIERHGRIDVLVNNAGLSNTGPVETMDLTNAHRVLDTNFWGPILVIRAVMPTMRAQRSGVVINVSSLASRIPSNPYGSMYAASKVGLNAVTESLNLEAAPFGIRAVSIEPGFFETAIQDNLIGADEAASPVYAKDQEWMRSFMDAGGTEGHADASVVAAAIVEAATDPATPVHVPVGDDAAMYLGMLADIGLNGWAEAVTPIVEAAVGPRPEAD